MIVIDASATVEILLNTPRAGTVRDALADEQQWHAPELLDPEVLSVIRRWTHRGWIDSARGSQAVDDLGDLALVRYRHETQRRRVWQLRERFSAYDACYVALAEALDAELVTTDDRLRRAARGLVAVR